MKKKLYFLHVFQFFLHLLAAEHLASYLFEFPSFFQVEMSCLANFQTLKWLFITQKWKIFAKKRKKIQRHFLLQVVFLDATTHLYKNMCLSVRMRVGSSVRLSVRWSRFIFKRRKSYNNNNTITMKTNQQQQQQQTNNNKPTTTTITTTTTQLMSDDEEVACNPMVLIPL